MTMYRAGRINEPSFLQRMADTIGLGGGEAAPEDDLDAWLARTLKDELGFKIERDDDGDLAIRTAVLSSSSVAMIRNHPS
ncbi:hypothetical protein ACPCIR_05385 [Mycobacterium sp. NPDC051198]